VRREGYAQGSRADARARNGCEDARPHGAPPHHCRCACACAYFSVRHRRTGVAGHARRRKPRPSSRARCPRRFQARLPANSSVTIGSTAVSWRGDQGLILQARDVKVALPDVATGRTCGTLHRSPTASAVLARRIDFDSVAIQALRSRSLRRSASSQEGSPADIARSAAKVLHRPGAGDGQPDPWGGPGKRSGP
jgi:hypothetical protein